MSLTIELSDEQANVLPVTAATAGLSGEEWIQKLAAPLQPVPDRPLQAAGGIISLHYA